MSENEPDQQPQPQPQPEPEPLPKRKSLISISRQRLVEFTVVVLGVLVALGLENLIQEARFRADARDLERAFFVDIAGAALHSLERQAVAPCLVQRLRALSERVDAATGELGAAAPWSSQSNFVYATPQIYRAPVRVWVTASFERALGSEAFKRIPSDRAIRYAGVFAQISHQQERNTAEFHATTGLAPLAYSQPNMNAEVRADALQQIANLDRYQALITGASGQIVDQALSFPTVREEMLRRAKDEEFYQQFRSARTEAYGECVDFAAIDKIRALAAP